MKKMYYFSKRVLITLVILFVVAGWLGNDIYRDYSNKRAYNGLYIVGNYTEAGVEGYAKQNYDSTGTWVCVNVKGMTYEKGMEVCEHEIAHEIFATYCGKDDNINKCMNITK